MIHQFKVKNHLSIREEQILDFTASSDRTYEEYTVATLRNYRISKIGVIYGANASGKSNILISLNWLLDYIVSKKDSKKDEMNIDIIPFLLDENSRNKPTEMYLSFFIGDIRYEYLLELDNTRIYKEEMYYYPSNRKALIYKRRWIESKGYSSLSFGNSLKLNSLQRITIHTNSVNHLTVLSAYINANVEKNAELEKIKDFFSKTTMPLLTSQIEIGSYANKILKSNDKCKEFVRGILSKADFNITDLFIKEKTQEISDEDWKQITAFAKLIQQPEPKDRKISMDELYFTHKTPFFQETFEDNFESQGTRRMYGLSVILFWLVNHNKILLADELESSLHYDLLVYFIKLFLINSSRGQLIFSTHILMLLDEKIIRRDMIFFAEKNVAGATEIFKAKEFGLHKDVSLLNAYRAGKLGAKPDLGSMYLD